MAQQEERLDLYQRVTNQIIEAIELGVDAWEMPWHRQGNIGRPKNALSKTPYHGINVLVLWATAQVKIFKSGWWGTYRQWSELGGQVRKGERATTVVWYQETTQNNAGEENETQAADRRFMARAFSVFNASQVDGWVEPIPSIRDPVSVMADVDTFVAATGAVVVHEGDRASYSPIRDCIAMPDRRRFIGSRTSTATDAYYSTLLHELTHWTGHTARLDRNLSGRFGSEAYAMEELVAELGAAFLCTDLGVSNVPRPDHAAYVANWLKVLRGDRRAIFSAASLAGQAVAFLGERSEVEGEAVHSG